MKKYLLIGFILGGLVFGTIGTVVAYNYNAKDIGYTPKDTSWDVNNVGDALKDLKDNKKIDLDLLWTNPTPTSAFSAQTINLDLSNYKYLGIVSWARTSLDYKKRTMSIVYIGDSDEQVLSATGTGNTRFAHANSTGVTISNPNPQGASTTFVIPYKIYGIKDNLNVDID